MADPDVRSVPYPFGSAYGTRSGNKSLLRNRESLPTGTRFTCMAFEQSLGQLQVDVDEGIEIAPVEKNAMAVNRCKDEFRESEEIVADGMRQSISGLADQGPNPHPELDIMFERVGELDLVPARP